LLRNGVNVGWLGWRLEGLFMLVGVNGRYGSFGLFVFALERGVTALERLVCVGTFVSVFWYIGVGVFG
jgi:hypothetical protein